MNEYLKFNPDTLSWEKANNEIMKNKIKFAIISLCIGALVSVTLTCIAQNKRVDSLTQQRDTAVSLYKQTDSINNINYAELMELRKINKIRYNKNPNKKDITGFIDKELVTNGVPKEIIQKVINVESTYNINAVSSTGCSGLMQLCRRVRSMYSNHHLVLNLNPWESNIQMGTLYLSLLHKQFNSWEKALNAYNSGYPHKGYGKTICRQLNIKI